MINSIMNVLRNVRFISIEGNNNINGIYEHFIKLMGTWEFLFIVIIYAIIYWIYSNKYFRDNKKIIQIILTILFFSIIGCFYWKKLSLLLIIGGFFVLISSIFSERDEKEKGELVEEENLYPTRNEFKGIFLEALKRYNLIALDGSWGSGKTFFIEKALEEKKVIKYL